MTFSLLVLHMWLILRRLKEEGKDGVELGQYLYEIYNHDVELRVSKAGVCALTFHLSLFNLSFLRHLLITINLKIYVVKGLKHQ